MSITKLNIFSKNRDATAAMRGYEFQHLKTLESWISNRINQTDEVIYCDFEEDIFSRNIGEGVSKFRQIKLYSTDFSFSSEAIQNTLANFFMLYVKGEYLFDQVNFSFETNASVVARVVKGNDADLLQEWVNNQGNLDQDLLKKIRVRTKQILSEYIQKEYDAKIGHVEVKPEVQQAAIIFKNLDDDFFNGFIKTIEWKFEGIDINVAMQNQLNDIGLLIEKIPLPTNDSTQVSLALLYREVITKSIQDNPDDRQLTNDLLDFILLQTGSEKNKWYANVYDKWLHAEALTEFHTGEFYEIINASTHSRINFHKSGHRDLWLKILLNYIANVPSEVVYKRKAIYECIFLFLSPNPESGETMATLEGFEDQIRFYFNNWTERNSLLDIEEDITLLQIILTQKLLDKVKLEDAEIMSWKSVIQNFIEEGMLNGKGPDDKCIFFELRGSLELHAVIQKSLEIINKSIGFYREILPILTDAKLYSIAPLYDQLSEIKNLLIRFNKEPEIVTVIEDFLDDIQEAALNSGNRHIIAKRLVRQGVDHIHAGGLNNFLQALKCFHKAKALWYLEYTKEGYILSLLNLAQVYYALGMNIAGKYYSLCAIWATWHSQDASKYNRISQGMGLLFYGDFKQGVWMAALDSFELFVKTREEFNPEGWAGGNDDMFSKTLPDVAFIIFASKQFSNELTVYLDFRVNRWGDLWNAFVKPLVDAFPVELSEETKLIGATRRNITYEPLSDIGKERTISFNALGIGWNINFENTHTLTSIAEEFISILQVFLAEIARLAPDFLSADKVITIKIEESVGYERIKKHQIEDDWIAAIPKFDSKEQKEITYHYAFISIMIKEVFLSVTTFTKERFTDFWWQILHEKEKIGDKAFCTNTFQKVYRNAVSEENFNASQKTAFTPIPRHHVFPDLPKLLV